MNINADFLCCIISQKYIMQENVKDVCRDGITPFILLHHDLGT